MIFEIRKMVAARSSIDFNQFFYQKVFHQNIGWCLLINIINEFSGPSTEWIRGGSSSFVPLPTDVNLTVLTAESSHLAEKKTKQWDLQI